MCGWSGGNCVVIWVMKVNIVFIVLIIIVEFKWLYLVVIILDGCRIYLLIFILIGSSMIGVNGLFGVGG